MSGTEPPARPKPLVPLGAVFAVLAIAVLAIALVFGTNPFGPGTPDADSVDVGFAHDMTVHHQQAVEMAAWERDRTADPGLRQLAFDIESTQNQQIGRMQGWLGLWDQPALPTGEHMTWMSGGHEHGDGHASGHAPGMDMGAMPGMASSEDLRRMRQTPEPALDVVFLQLMLRHHQGGVSMLEYAEEHAETAEARNLATQMLTAQTAESELMTRLLAERGAKPLPR